MPTAFRGAHQPSDIPGGATGDSGRDQSFYCLDEHDVARSISQGVEAWNASLPGRSVELDLGATEAESPLEIRAMGEGTVECSGETYSGGVTDDAGHSDSRVDKGGGLLGFGLRVAVIED